VCGALSLRVNEAVCRNAAWAGGGLIRLRGAIGRAVDGVKDEKEETSLSTVWVRLQHAPAKKCRI
jgi:hypothetical protein